jgi:RNA polymerase sigma factor (TIGR02999 family)
MESPGVTQLLQLWESGDSHALDELLPLVYVELRRLAGGHLRNERPDISLQATALVHETYLRLVDQNDTSWQSRLHFFSVASQMMRRVLVDHARTRDRMKRGGGAYKLGLSGAHPMPIEPDVDLIELDEALERLALVDSQKARIIELRFFGGLTIEQTSEVLGVSHATVERGWTMARAWLKREMTRTN